MTSLYTITVVALNDRDAHDKARWRAQDDGFKAVRLVSVHNIGAPSRQFEMRAWSVTLEVVKA